MTAHNDALLRVTLYVEAFDRHFKDSWVTKIDELGGQPLDIADLRTLVQPKQTPVSETSIRLDQLEARGDHTDSCLLKIAERLRKLEPQGDGS
jgi:hypothetical protein